MRKHRMIVGVKGEATWKQGTKELQLLIIRIFGSKSRQ